jgi:formyl-CoA transferase
MLKPPFNFEGMDAPMNAIPAVGAHTDAILRELGIEDATIREWRAAQIV